MDTGILSAIIGAVGLVFALGLFFWIKSKPSGTELMQEISEVIHEAADLIYHAWVLLAEAGVTPEQVRQELAGRAGTSGLEEKATRKT